MGILEGLACGGYSGGSDSADVPTVFSGKINVKLRTPRNMFLDVSKPAAYILAILGFFRSHRIRHANLEIVLCITRVSPVLSPGTVSITTKSMGASEERPICNERDELAHFAKTF